MKDSEVRARVAHYRQVIDQWSANLLELDDHPTYRLLAAGEMSGVTGDRANTLIDSAPQLWTWLGLLRHHMKMVDDVVAQETRFSPKTVEVAALITQPSIMIEVFDGTARNLAHNLIEVDCDGLVSHFNKLYAQVRDVVADIDAVWRDIMPRIEAATFTLHRANGLSERLDVSLPQVRLANQRLEAVRATVLDDPLSLSGKVGPDLDRMVASAANAAGSIERSHESLGEDLANADEILADLRVLRARAAAAYSEAKAKISPTTKLLAVPSTSIIDGQGGLAHRARQFEGFVEAGGDWRETREVVDDWQSAAARLKHQLEKALANNTEPLERRTDLRGLLSAYQVKATMLVDLPTEVSDLGQSARDELFTSPTDLDGAQKLIDQFAAALTSYGVVS